MQERLLARGVVCASISTCGEFPWGEKQVIDVFGPWSPVDEMCVDDVTKCRLPDPTVQVQPVLEANFDFTENQTLPYDVFDALRTQHSIDLTGFNLSMTRHGNIYRSSVLMRGV